MKKENVECCEGKHKMIIPLIQDLMLKTTRLLWKIVEPLHGKLNLKIFSTFDSWEKRKNER